MEYLLQENFPQGTQFVWTVEAGSDTAEILLAAADDTRLDHGIIDVLEIDLPAGKRDKHQLVTGLYNTALAKVEAALVLLIEDDVVAPVGTYAKLTAAWDALPEHAAACMVAYRSRTRPEYFCAGDIYQGYVPLAAPRDAEPLEMNWVGGGFTLYLYSEVRKCLPVKALDMGGWTKGWDVDLCEKLRAAGSAAFLLRNVVAEHC